ADDVTVIALYRLPPLAPPVGEGRGGGTSRTSQSQHSAAVLPERPPTPAAGTPAAAAPAPPSPDGDGSVWRALTRYAADASSGPPMVALIALTGLVAFVEWRLGTGLSGPRSAPPASPAAAVAVAIVLAPPWLALITVLGTWTTRMAQLPVPVL